MGEAFSDLKIFSKMLTVTNRRVHLLQCFQVIVCTYHVRVQDTINNFVPFYIKILLTSLHVFIFSNQFFKSLIDHGILFEEGLRVSYKICHLRAYQNPVAEQKLINLGLRIGEFISDAGWYTKSEHVLLACKKLCVANNSTPEDWCRTLECYRG